MSTIHTTKTIPAVQAYIDGRLLIQENVAAVNDSDDIVGGDSSVSSSRQQVAQKTP